MNTTDTMEGRCLCGATSIRVPASQSVEACHCGMCRRWGGGPFLSIHCDSVDIEGKDAVATFRSSEWAERGFCKTCGTHLYYHLVPADTYAVPAGLFQNQQGLEFKEQIFIDKKPPYYAFANSTAMLTEAQVFEKFAPD